jgi:UDP-N-acetylglucosamine acyltransferase
LSDHSGDASGGGPRPRVHPSAVVGPEVELGMGVEVGAFCFLDGRIRIGAATRLMAHVTILGDTQLGEHNVLHPNVVIGDEPQDLAYSGGPRAVRIGDRNVFREGATVNRGSERGEITIVGNDNFVMSNAHIGHDCRVGNSIILAGGALLAGWVEVGDSAFISGNCVVHQYVRVGRFVMMRGLSRASRDLPPFCIADLKHTVRGINIVGLRRAGFSTAAIMALRKAFRALFGARQNLKLAIERLESEGAPTPEVAELIEFIRASKRGVAFGLAQPGAADSDG